ncbi:tryptophan-rich sensory protein [Sporosarcina trichiuri]|uniref:tryptophan-rich sensory protein n=1 Tax=Sporosarcina trichiuri TaxID=3056445 RepID=UPI0025B5AE0E|nr:tryptophan-rich sensory protein [Sporosarcina sp. 0.2-SM1T-5]WJY27638.1 tryptophan-rich sensory protein [Sporosarcina sp. 0.2-SM1T-5]
MKKMICSFAFLLLTGSVLLSNTIPVNGQTTIEIAHKLPVLLLPADYALLIRPLLLVILAYWIIKMRSSDFSAPLRIVLFSIACLLNAVWFPLWHYSHYARAFTVTIVLLITLYLLYRTYPKKRNDLAGRVPISLFLAWTIVDLVLNANYLLVFDEWSRLGLSIVLWTILNLSILAAVALHFSFHHRDGAITAVILWVFLGIIVNVWMDELFITLSALFLMALMVFGYWILSPSTVQSKSEETLF